MINEYEKLYWFDHLYQAYRLAARGKHDRDEVIRFEMDLSGNLWSLHDEIREKRYRIGGYHRFIIHDPKMREIQALSFRDRVVQHG